MRKLLIIGAAAIAAAVPSLSHADAAPTNLALGSVATASSDPHCTFNPGAVPKAVDVIGGQSQLDYTLGPVAIQPVQ